MRIAELFENCKHGRYYCSTDKKWKCRQSPKKSRTTESQQELEEGVGSTLAKLGLVGAVAAGGAGAYNAAQDYKDAKDTDTAKVAQAPAQDKKDLSKIEIPAKQDTQAKTEYKPLTSNKNEIILAKHARDAGIKGIELASFMSQMAHESENFSDMIEDISHERAAKKYGLKNTVQARLQRYWGTKAKTMQFVLKVADIFNSQDAGTTSGWKKNWVSI